MCDVVVWRSCSKVDVSDALWPPDARNAGRKIRCLLHLAKIKALMAKTTSCAQQIPDSPSGCRASIDSRRRPMSGAVIGAGGQPSGQNSRIEGRNSPSSQLQCLVRSEARENADGVVELNKAQKAQRGKAGAARLCTYRRPGLGPHLASLECSPSTTKPESWSSCLFPVSMDPETEEIYLSNTASRARSRIILHNSRVACTTGPRRLTQARSQCLEHVATVMHSG